MLEEGLQICEHLAGMKTIGQGIDDRDAGDSRKRLDRMVGECTCGDGITHFGQHPRSILDRLPATELGVSRRQEDGSAAGLDHRSFERHARAGGGLFENHRKNSARQRLLALTCRTQAFEFGCSGEHPPQLCR